MVVETSCGDNRELLQISITSFCVKLAIQHCSRTDEDGGEDNRGEDKEIVVMCECR